MLEMYKIEFEKKARKNLKKINSEWALRISQTIKELQKNPHIGKKLDGSRKGQRVIRVWPYRIIYRIREKELIIIVLDIAHRQGVYT